MPTALLARTSAAAFARSTPLVLVITAMTLTAVVGCTNVVQGQGVRSTANADSTTAATAGADCTQVDAPMTRIPSGDGDPVASIPQPSGWKSSTKITSEMIPFTMGNTELNAGGFTPNVVVTRESIASTVSADAIFEQSRAALTTVGATDLVVTPSMVCGLPAERIEYTVPAMLQLDPHAARVLIVSVPAGGRTFAFSVTAQSADPTNTTYQQDSQTILDGFQVKPPGA